MIYNKQTTKDFECIVFFNDRNLRGSDLEKYSGVEEINKRKNGSSPGSGSSWKISPVENNFSVVFYSLSLFVTTFSHSRILSAGGPIVQ